MERLVEVTFRGLRVAKGAKLDETGEQGFLELDAPLPVGTRVTVSGEGDFRVEARVVGVVEQGTAGMRLDWAPPKADAGTTLEIDPETDAVADDAGLSGSMPAMEEAGASTPPAGESRGARRRRKKQNGKP